MAAPSPKEVTRLLVDWGNGDQAALDELIPLVYDDAGEAIQSLDES